MIDLYTAALPDDVFTPLERGAQGARFGRRAQRASTLPVTASRRVR
ncbi:hypothetical protein [Stutzerimonas nosocomialis]|nr:hypothetical protein [Stutzerimonas nosocomialis]